MVPAIVSLSILAVLVLATHIGLRLRAFLPDHHLSNETKDAVRIGMGSVATMAALVLGLLVTSTKSAYDAEKSEVVQISAKAVYLDQLLANCGEHAAESREALRAAVEAAIVRIWPNVAMGSDSRHSLATDPGPMWTRTLPESIQRMTPTDDTQRAFKGQAAQLASDLGQMRWLLFEQSESSISVPLLVIMVSWLALTFVSVGLFAPRNATVFIAQFCAALSIAGAIFLILELDQPFGGLIEIPSTSMVDALNHMGH
ncbi:MAG: hypothetical protein U0572_00775 [Phycisphaerales bacterium]